MYIIDKNFFIKEYFIPNLNEFNNPILNELNTYIETSIRDFLLELLGVDDYNELNTFILGGVVNSALPDKWNWFFNGKEYINSSGHKVKWSGIIYSQSENKLSLLVPYLCFKIFYDKQTQFTNVGEKVINSINSNSANPYKRAVFCWNSFLDMYQGSLIYKENYFNCFDNNNFRNVRVSLLEFLQDHKSIFQNVNYVYYQRENQLGI